MVVRETKNNRAAFERVTSLSFIEPSAVASPRSQYCETTDRLFSCLEARQKDGTIAFLFPFSVPLSR